MIFQLREMERVESRVLGALRCIDAGTRTQVARACGATAAACT
jgi:hypothetical protein